MSPGEDYLQKCRGLVEAVERQMPAIRQAADWFAQTILAGRMVHCFGSGHSRIMVEEMWPRYGSFPGFNPIVELSLTLQPGRRRQRAAAGDVPRKRDRAVGADPAQLRPFGAGQRAGDLVQRLQPRAD
jgi:uncharacterized phosphosugar-binding protein